MLNNILKCFIAILCCFTANVNSQIVISKPDPDPSFTFLCQSLTVNTNHRIRFTVSPVVNIQSGNAFSLEMSNDDFNSNIVSLSPITVSPGGSASEFFINFTLPTSTYGTGYQLRVKSSAPATTGTKSDPFDAYYMSHNQEIKLNIASGIDNISFCTGSSITLFIYDSGTNTSPLFYPNLQYTWKKRVGFTDTVIGTGPSISVNQVGQYFVETNYGVCTPSSNSISRLVTVSESAASTIAISTVSGTNQICEGTPEMLSLNVINNPLYVFQWFLNGNAIAGANTNSYGATLAGSYTATVDNGSCVAEANPYMLNAIQFNASLNLASPQELAIGGTLNAIVTTDSNTPTYQWFLNGSPLSETSSSLIISAYGQYTVVVTQTVGCVATNELTLYVIAPDVADIPNLISPNGDGVNDFFKVPFELISNNNLNLQIFNSSGKNIYSTENYQNDWPQDTNEIFKSSAFFYFNLSRDNKIIKEGVLTIIK
jgi:gliding motility-associated-like protein